jgi:hypothetical protein
VVAGGSRWKRRRRRRRRTLRFENAVRGGQLNPFLSMEFMLLFPETCLVMNP